MTAPTTTVPDDAIDTAALKAVTRPARSADGPLGPFPIIDSQGRMWTADRITRLAHNIGSDAMTKALTDDDGKAGREQYAFDFAYNYLDRLVYDVMSGDHLELAVRGARTGFVAAACAFWHDIGVQTGIEARNLDLAALALESEVLAWTAIPGVAIALVDAAYTGLAVGRQQRPPEPPSGPITLTGRDTPARHVTRPPRKEPASP